MNGLNLELCPCLVEGHYCLQILLYWEAAPFSSLTPLSRGLEKLRWLLYERFLIKFPKYSPIVDTVCTRLLTIKDASTGELAAFSTYGYDAPHRTIVAITAAVNEKYHRYSPGLICALDFIRHCIAEGRISYYDFTRGIEPYKYWLGAKDRKVTNISIRLQP